MILALQEDGTLRVFPDPAALEEAIEPLDIEETLEAAFDEAGRPYVIEWLWHNTQSPTLLGVSIVENGEYRLVQRGAPDTAALIRTIRTATHFDPPSAEGFIRALEQELSQRA
jgi:hypothetical protein